MAAANIKSTSDQESMFRCQEIKIRDKVIQTPIKAIDYHKIDLSVEMNNNLACINELYHGISKTRLSNHICGADHSLSSFLNTYGDKYRNTSKEPQFCFLKYIGDSFPESAETEYLTDQAYANSDITPIPMVSDFLSKITSESLDNKLDNKLYNIPNFSKFEDGKKYILDAIKTIEQLNNKPIMGYVPDYRPYFKEFVKLYFDNDINTFYFDAHLSSPMTIKSSLRAFMRELNVCGILENSFIHVINVGYGRVLKNSIITPAKDILGYGLGIDSLGERHMRRPMPREVYYKLAQNPDKRPKLFNKRSYGYYKTKDKNVIKTFYPDDTKIDIKKFLISERPNKKIENTFNVEQLALESSKLQKEIKDSKSVLNYLNDKSDIQASDMKILKNAKVKNRK